MKTDEPWRYKENYSVPEIPANYTEFFSRVKGLQPSQGSRWNALCPAHEDQRRSLSIAIGNSGNLIVKCHSPHGCTYKQIVDALGLKAKDMFPDDPRKPEHKKQGASVANNNRKIIDTYDYEDESGRILYRVFRFDPKDFSQSRANPNFDPTRPIDYEPGGNSPFIAGMADTRRVLFRLPKLLADLKERPDRFVLLLEGEKDVKTAHANGLCATCNPMGAEKWNDSYSEVLRGRNVAIWPDEDPVSEKTGYSPGLRHAYDVADSLLKFGAKPIVVRVSKPKPGGDFTDWWVDHPEKKVPEKKAALGRILQSIPLHVLGERPPEARPRDWANPNGATETKATQGQMEFEAPSTPRDGPKAAETEKAPPGAVTVELFAAYSLAIMGLNTMLTQMVMCRGTDPKAAAKARQIVEIITEQKWPG